MATANLKVEGMTCEGCAGSVKRAVERLDGVQQVDVSLPAKSVTVAFDEAKTGADAIRRQIEDAGYDVVG